MNTTIFLDVNRFARRTDFLHGAFGALAGRAGLVLVAAVLVLGLAQARLTRSMARPGLAASSWPLLAVAITLGLGDVLGHVLDRARPAASLKGIELIGTPGTGFSLPDLRVAAAAAVAVGLLVLGARAAGALGALVALVLAFAEIYVGAHYPLDELAALGLGTLVAVAGFPLARHRAMGTATARRPPSLTAELAGLGRAGSLGHAGPAATPVPLAATGSVRLLEAPSGGGEVGTLPKPRLVALQPASVAGTAAGQAAVPARGSGSAGGAGPLGAAPPVAGVPAAATGAAGDSASGSVKAGPLPSFLGGGSSSDEKAATIAVFPRPPAPSGGA